MMLCCVILCCGVMHVLLMACIPLPIQQQAYWEIEPSPSLSLPPPYYHCITPSAHQHHYNTPHSALFLPIACAYFPLKLKPSSWLSAVAACSALSISTNANPWCVHHQSRPTKKNHHRRSLLSSPSRTAGPGRRQSMTVPYCPNNVLIASAI